MSSKTEFIEPCTWTHRPDWEIDYEEDNVWHSSCGEDFQITEGKPSDNQFNFCCFCGRKIVEKIIVSRYEDEDA